MPSDYIPPDHNNVPFMLGGGTTGINKNTFVPSHGSFKQYCCLLDTKMSVIWNMLLNKNSYKRTFIKNIKQLSLKLLSPPSGSKGT